MTSSIDTVSDKIDSVTSERSNSITCSEFVDLVTSFSSVCGSISQITTIETLELEIDNSSVSSCSSTEISSLSSLKTSINATRQDLEDLIETYQEMLIHSSTSFPTQVTSGKDFTLEHALRRFLRAAQPLKCLLSNLNHFWNMGNF